MVGRPGHHVDETAQRYVEGVAHDGADARTPGPHHTAGASHTARDPGKHGPNRIARATAPVSDSRCPRKPAGQRGALSLTNSRRFVNRLECRSSRERYRTPTRLGSLHRTELRAISRTRLVR